MNQYIAGDLGDFLERRERQISIILGLDDEYCEKWILKSLKKEIEYHFREEIKREYFRISGLDGYGVSCEHPDIERKIKCGILSVYYDTQVSINFPKYDKRWKKYYPPKIGYPTFHSQSIYEFEYRLKCMQFVAKIANYLECCLGFHYPERSVRGS